MAELILVGDRVLIYPLEGEQRTEAGLILPATVAESDRVRSGRVVRVGPGYLTANPEYSDEPWKSPAEAVRYLPLQAQPGDIAFFLRKEAINLTYEGKSYVIVPHSAILALVRPDPKDLLENLEDLLGEKR
ncbi:MAG TPA: co-chaperone GroES family protein [Candidatus Nitrosotenuis sp.]|jgi:co-chaperonin GroES (HSP10)|nr:co-chaperone GroES family protein [Candidatus Nitrosotenuis sp.]